MGRAALAAPPASLAVVLRPEDIQIDTYRSGINCPAVVRARHRPTGCVAEAEDSSQLRAREAALRKLRAFVSARYVAR